MQLRLACAPSRAYREQLLALPGLTAAHLVEIAEEYADIAAEADRDGFTADAQAWREFAWSLLDATPRFPNPPRRPALVVEAA